MEFLAGLAVIALVAYIGYRIVKKEKDCSLRTFGTNYTYFSASIS